MTLQPLVHLHQKDARQVEERPRYIIPRGLMSAGPDTTVSSGHVDTRVQNTLVNKEIVQTRYAVVLESIFEGMKQMDEASEHRVEGLETEFLYLRHEVETQNNLIFDLTELIGRLAEKIEQWVGVAEEDPVEGLLDGI